VEKKKQFNLEAGKCFLFKGDFYATVYEIRQLIKKYLLEHKPELKDNESKLNQCIIHTSRLYIRKYRRNI